MKIEFNLEAFTVDDYWGETVAERIKQIVLEQIDKEVKKMAKAEIQKNKALIEKYVKELSAIELQKTIKKLS